MSDYEDVDYTVEGATAVITINRPERYNAFRGRTVEELIQRLPRGVGGPRACRR